MVEELKNRGNTAFTAGDYIEAEKIYSEAIEQYGGSNVLHTNRAAAKFQLSKYQECIADCDQAIKLDPKWVKAYFRKASSFEKIGDIRSCFETWSDAIKNCEVNAWLLNQMKTVKSLWLKNFKTQSVVSKEDLLSRYKLFKDSRERLSTLAHFWNISSSDERLKHFRFFISMIGGDSAASNSIEDVTAEVLPAMPMDNYRDLPRSNIEAFCAYFENQTSDDKTIILKSLWDILTNAEQTTVVTDLRLFVAHCTKAAAEAAKESVVPRVEEL